jgi:DNA-binding NarL/FixJ family response regulator
MDVLFPNVRFSDVQIPNVLIPYALQRLRILQPTSALHYSLRRVESAARQSVLIVDQEPVAQHGFTRVLSAKFNVVVVSSVSEAFAFVRAGARFNVVLIELAFGESDSNSITLAKAISDVAPSQGDGVIYMTSKPLGELTPAMAGFVDGKLLRKPFGLKQFTAAVTRVAQRNGGASTQGGHIERR